MTSATFPAPDEVLLRRFGLVRAVGGAAFVLAVGVLAAIYGLRVWPLLVGVVVLAVVTTGYFQYRGDRPRTAVAVSLAADALVLAGAIAYLGGTGAGLVGLYAIVVVSAGILLGTRAALIATAGTFVLAIAQLGLEEMVEPAVLYRSDLEVRVPVLLLSLAGLGSVGYLTATYAGRLHEIIAEAGSEAADVRAAGRRRRVFVERASAAVQQPLTAVERVADALQDTEGALSHEQRHDLAARLRIAATALDAEVGQLADVGAMDQSDPRPQVILLSRVVEDCRIALGERLARHHLVDETGPERVLGDRRAARRVVYNLLNNVVEHTPPGTTVEVRSMVTGSVGVLVVADDGPGIAPERRDSLFTAERGNAEVGLPLVAELCRRMGAEIVYDPPRSGTGARFLLSFRLAPAAAPSPDEIPAVGSEEAIGADTADR